MQVSDPVTLGTKLSYVKNMFFYDHTLYVKLMWNYVLTTLTYAVLSIAR